MKILYTDLLGAVKLDRDTADFKELRISYAQSAEYSPYNLNIDIYKSIANALHEKDFQMVIRTIVRLMETCYLDIDAHGFSASIYRRMGDETKSAYHLWPKLRDGLHGHKYTGRTCYFKISGY